MVGEGPSTPIARNMTHVPKALRMVPSKQLQQVLGPFADLLIAVFSFCQVLGMCHQNAT